MEICEQLAASWLKHIKGCQLVEVNWRPSPVNFVLDKRAVDDLMVFMDEIKAAVSDDELDIFKKNKAEQFVMQTEIDVIGLKITDTVIDELYLVDTAFHKDGLGYGELVARVIKKIIRAIVISDLVFHKIPSKIVFISPYCKEKDKTKVLNGIAKVEPIIKAHYPDSEVMVIFNEDFTTEVYEPLAKVEPEITDYNDMFLRSLKIERIAKGFAPSTYSTSLTTGSPATSAASKTTRGGNLTTVLDVLNELQSKGLITTSVIDDLRNPVFTKRTFNISTYPMLISPADFAASGFEKCRFYPRDRFRFDGVDYLICNQWIPDRIRRLLAWRDKLVTP